MNDAVLMKMAQSLGRFPRNGSDLALAHDVAGDNVSQTASLHVLHDDPEIALPEIRVNEVDNVLVPRRLHDQDLVDDQILLRLFLQVHLFDGDADIGTGLVRRVDASRCAVDEMSASALSQTSAMMRTLDQSC